MIVGLGALGLVLGTGVGCREELEEQKGDGLVANMFRGDGEAEKETVVVVVDMHEGEAEQEQAAAGNGADSLDTDEVNVVVVFRDGNGSDDGEYLGQVMAISDLSAPEGADLRFSGEWVRRVHTESYIVTIQLELKRSGAYIARIDGEERNSGEPVRGHLKGAWDARGDDVLVQVHETSNPGVFPKGMLEVFGNGRIGEGVWTFLDSNGVRRTARRPRLETAPLGDSGGELAGVSSEGG